jgi:predicted PurR-regulated permease PerM
MVKFLCALLVIATLYFGREFLIPIALAILIAFLLAPVVTFFERRGLARFPAVFAVVLSVAAAVGTMGWFAIGQVTDFAQHLPEYKQTLQRKVDDVRGYQGVQLERAAQVVQELGRKIDGAEPTPSPDVEVQHVQVAEPRIGALGTIRNALGSVLKVLGFAAIVILLVVFMLVQRVELRDHLIWLAGDQRLHVTTQMLEDASKRVSEFLFAQFVVNCIHGGSVAIGLTIIGVPNSLLWGLASCLLRFIPYVGPWIAASGPMVVSLAVFDGWSEFIYTASLFAVIELLSNNLLEPLFYEERTGASPLAIIVSALFWTWLWGGVGLVLAMPLTVCMMVVGDHIPHLRFISTLLGKKSGLSTAARFYQRLLAADREGATEIAQKLLDTVPLVDVLDGTVLPGLGMAAQDFRLGHVDELRQESIEQNVVEIVEELAERPRDSNAIAPQLAPTAIGGALRVVCLPASDSEDEVASRMLAVALREQGMDCEVVSVERFASEMLEAVARIEPDVVCISHVPPPRLAQVRYLAKRLAERFPSLPVIVGIWTNGVDEGRIRSRLPRNGQFHVVTSFAEARSQARELFELLRHRPDRGASSREIADADSGEPRIGRGDAAPAGA